MKENVSFFFVFRDVIIRSLSWALTQKLGENRNDLYKLEDDYSIGRISTEAFFDQLSHILQDETKPSDIWSLIYQRSMLIEGILSILNELKEDYTLHGFSHFPPDILDKLLLKFGLDTMFDKDNIIYSAEYTESILNDSLFKRLIDENWIQPHKTVWIDAQPKRTSQAIRFDISSIIFVDARRLRREIALRGLLPLLGDE